MAQEAVKACGKYTPLQQWLHVDALEVLPAEHPADAAMPDGPGTRYDHTISMFGRAFLNTLQVSCAALCLSSHTAFLSCARAASCLRHHTAVAHTHRLLSRCARL